MSVRHHQPLTLQPRSARTRYSAAAAASVVAVSAALLATAGTAHAAALPVPMGTAEPFAVLGGTGITSTGHDHHQRRHRVVPHPGDERDRIGRPDRYRPSR